MKKKLVVIFGIVVLLLIVGLCSYDIYNRIKNNTAENESNNKNEEQINNFKLYIYEDKNDYYSSIKVLNTSYGDYYQVTYKKIGEYECLSTEKCYGYDAYYEEEMDELVICDGECFFYNYITKEKKQMTISDKPENITDINIVGYENKIYGLIITENNDYSSQSFYYLENSIFVSNNEVYDSIGYNKISLLKDFVWAETEKDNIFTVYTICTTTGEVSNKFSRRKEDYINYLGMIWNEKQNYFKSYCGCGDPTFRVYTLDLKPISNKKFTDYFIDSNGDIILSNMNSPIYQKYNSNGKLLYTSRNYKSVLSLTKDYFLAIDTDGFYKIFDYKDKVIKKLIKSSKNNAACHISLKSENILTFYMGENEELIEYSYNIKSGELSTNSENVIEYCYD